MAAAHVGRLTGCSALLSFDMGGTTAKAGIVRDGRPAITHDFQVGGSGSYGHRRAGTGFPLKVPTVDLAEVGAGGGCIAWVDGAGALRVGPPLGGRRSRPRLLRARRERPDGDRRQPRARVPGADEIAGGVHLSIGAGGRGPRARGRPPARDRRARRRLGRARDRQRHHGCGHQGRHRSAWRRSSRLHHGRLRRGRPHARGPVGRHLRDRPRGRAPGRRRRRRRGPGGVRPQHRARADPRDRRRRGRREARRGRRAAGPPGASGADRSRRGRLRCRLGYWLGCRPGYWLGCRLGGVDRHPYGRGALRRAGAPASRRPPGWTRHRWGRHRADTAFP